MSEEVPLRVESFQPADLEEILAIERVSFATPWTEAMFLEEMRNVRSSPLVFRLGTRLIGYLCFWEVLDEAHLMNICVHPEFRGQGWGTHMLAHLERMCKEKALARIILEVGRRNQPARNLYRKRGFRTVGFRKDYYRDIGDDALIMEKTLEDAPDGSRSNDMALNEDEM